MKRVLILFAHPALQKSKIHGTLLRELKGIEGVTLNDLYENYPDFLIDVSREKKLLLEHDVIVFQHPFYWYSSPALLKEWQDLVLEWGFAYGPGGESLKGKALISVLSTGGAKKAYAPEGHNHFYMKQLLTPFEQTARLCGMDYLPPFVIHGAHEYRKENHREALAKQAQDYRRLLVEITSGKFNLDAARNLDTLNTEEIGRNP